MSDIYTMPGHLIRRLQQISASIFAEHMKSRGLELTSPQFAALAMLKDHPRIDQATLAGLIAFDRPTIGGVVDRLVAKGLVQRETSKADRRSKSLTLTAQGEALLAELWPVVRASQDEILMGLDADERKEFIRLAMKTAEAGNAQSRAPLVKPGKPKSA